MVQLRDDAGGAFLVAFPHLVDQRDHVLQQRDLAAKPLEQAGPCHVARRLRLQRGATLTDRGVDHRQVGLQHFRGLWIQLRAFCFRDGLEAGDGSHVMLLGELQFGFHVLHERRASTPQRKRALWGPRVGRGPRRRLHDRLGGDGGIQLAPRDQRSAEHQQHQRGSRQRLPAHDRRHDGWQPPADDGCRRGPGRRCVSTGVPAAHAARASAPRRAACGDPPRARGSVRIRRGAPRRHRAARCRAALRTSAACRPRTRSAPLRIDDRSCAQQSESPPRTAPGLAGWGDSIVRSFMRALWTCDLDVPSDTPRMLATS